MKITFGKYKGEEIEDLPTDYIRWLLENTTQGWRLTEELEAQLRMREGEGVVRKNGY